MLYIDSADLDQVRPLLRTGVFAGVTTNPTILDRAGLGAADLPALFRELDAAGAGTIFMQTSGTTTERMLQAAERITAISQEIIVKVPSTPDGYAAARQLIQGGTEVLMTAVYHPIQAAAARDVGAWGIAPYVGRMADEGADWRRAIPQMAVILEGSSTRVLAASIRSVDIAAELLASGSHDITVAAPVARAIVRNELSDRALAQFESVSG